MRRAKFGLILCILLLTVSACSLPVGSSSTADSQLPEAPSVPGSIPATPTPSVINAPVVETPALDFIQFLNTLDGWGITETQVVRTNDGGVTWYNVTPQNVTETGYNATISVLDNNNVWVHLPDFEKYPNSGFLYRTSNGGMTWSSSSTPFSNGSLQFLDANNGWALANLGVATGSNAVAIFQTTNGGADWTQSYTNDPNNANAGNSLPLGGLKSGFAAINMQTAWVYGVIYSSGTPYLFRTDDGGADWKPVSLPLPPNAADYELSIDPGQMKFVTPTDGFIAMRFTGNQYQTAIYVTHDAGSTWTLTPTMIPDSGAADFLSANEAVVYNRQQFYATNDAAGTWSIIPPDVKFGDTFAIMDFVSPDAGWVVTSNPTDNHRSLYKTGDGGATWFPVIP